MPKVKTKTVTEGKVAEFFGLSTESLRRWKNTEDERMQHRYKALKDYYINDQLQEEEQENKQLEQVANELEEITKKLKQIAKE